MKLHVDWAADAAQALRDAAVLVERGEGTAVDYADIVAAVSEASGIHALYDDEGAEVASRAMRKLLLYLATHLGVRGGDIERVWPDGRHREGVALTMRAASQRTQGLTSTEYAVRHTQRVVTAANELLDLRVRITSTTRSQAEVALARTRAWQARTPVCDEIDAVIVTRTVTVTAWAEIQDARDEE